MRFAWFLALRYLKPKRTFVSVITLISIAGVALGVAVLLVVIAVMSGFEKKIKEEFLKVEPSIIVRDTSRQFLPDGGNPEEAAASEDAEALPAWHGIMAQVRQHPEVVSASPMLFVAAVVEKKPTEDEERILDAENRHAASVQAILYGIHPDDAVQIDRLQKLMDESGAGMFDVAGDGIVLTYNLAGRLERDFPIFISESQVNAYGPAFLRAYREYYTEQQRARNDEDKAAEVGNRDRDLPLPEEYTVSGIIDGSKLGNDPIGFISLRNAQRIAGSGRTIDGISVELRDPFRAGEVSEDLKAVLPDGWTPQTWMERHSNYFDAIASERSMMYFVLSIISVVAAFSIMNTMITVAVQKRREIGMMRALGASTRQIVGIFIAKGLVVASLGTLIGYTLGVTVLHFRNQIRNGIAEIFQIRIFDENIYGLREIPADPRILDNILICGIAFVLCTLAAVPPAWVVGRLEPARALRSDR